MKFKPDQNKEYVLVYDHPPAPGQKILVKKDTIVTNVHLSDRYHFMGGHLEFTVKRTGIKYQTHYGYMFAENTPENIERLKEFRAAVDKAAAYKVEVKKKLSKVKTVMGPFEGL